MKISRPTLPDGNDLYREISLPNAGVFPVTYWHLWIALLLTTQFSGDWDAMLAHFRQQTSMISWHREHAEGLVNHLLHLHQALDLAGLTPNDLVVHDAEPDFLKKQKVKARRKLMEFGFKEHEKSTWMRQTPRRQRHAHALRGYWEQFPISPLIFAPEIAAIFRTGRYYLEEESFKLERKLEEFLNKKKARLDIPGQLGLYRAFLTVILENINGVDDSFGVIGELYESIFAAYYCLDRAQINLPLETYFQDLLELLVWEDYAFTYRNQPDFFANLSEQEVPMAEAILRQQWHELGDLGLGYQSEKGLTMLGLLYTQQIMFEQFIPLAQAMGTGDWQRITLLAETAEKHQLYDLALGVYEACLRPGMHENYLQKEYEKLKQRVRQ